MTRRELAARVGVLLVGGAWLVVRAPNLILAPRFWAEEKYFVEVASRGDFFESLFAIYRRAGYYAWPDNLGAILGLSLLPLPIAPLAPTLLAFVLQLAPLALVLVARFDFPLSTAQRSLAGLALLCATTSGQSVTWLNVLSAPAHQGILACVILFASARQTSKRASASLLVALALASLAGVYAVFLWPAFVLAALAERERWRTRQAFVLGLGLLVQAAIVLHTHLVLGYANEKRGLAGEALDALVSGLRESVAMALFGRRSVDGAPLIRDVLLVLGLTTFACASVVLMRSRTSPSDGPVAARIARWGSLERRGLVAWLTVFGAVSLTAYHGLAAGRYAVVPGALTLAIVLMAASHADGPLARRAFALTILVAVSTGLYSPRDSSVLRCDGRTSGWIEAARRAAGPTRSPLPICPPGWSVTLAPASNRPSD